MTVKLNEEIAASLAVREALAGAEGQVRLLSTKLAGQMAAGEKAVTMKMAALSPAAGSEILRAADGAKDEADGDASARSAPGAASLLQANDLSRRDLVIQ